MRLGLGVVRPGPSHLGATPLAEISLLNPIALKKLFPIVLHGLFPLRKNLAGHVLCHSDNTAAAAQVTKLHDRDLLAAHILCFLSFFQAKFDFCIWAPTGADDAMRKSWSDSVSLPSSCAHVLPQLLDLSLTG